MRYLALILAIAAAGDKCCDQQNHDLLASGVNRIQECRTSGGVPVTVIIKDASDHAFIQLARCDFPIPLQREHLLPTTERAEDIRKEAE